MNNFIIDPSVFYWASILDAIKNVCIAIAVITLFGSISITLYYFWLNRQAKKRILSEDADNYEKRRYKESIEEYNEDMKYIKRIKKWMIILYIIEIISVVAAVLTPDKRTSIEMLIAKTVTYDKVNWTVQQVKEIVDYIVSALKGA